MNISSLQTDYLNIDSRSGFERNSEISNSVQTKCTFCVGTNSYTDVFFKRIRPEKEKARAAGASDNRRTERTSQKCFRCGSEEHLIGKRPKPPKDNEKRRKQVCFNERGNREFDNSLNNSDQKIYVSMACMYNNIFQSRFGKIDEFGW